MPQNPLKLSKPANPKPAFSAHAPFHPTETTIKALAHMPPGPVLPCVALSGMTPPLGSVSVTHFFFQWQPCPCLCVSHPRLKQILDFLCFQLPSSSRLLPQPKEINLAP